MNILQLYLLFAKIGFFTFGGGFAMIPFFYHELVQNHHLLSAEEFANMVALAQVTPGPIGLNAATYIGFQRAGIWGALAGTLGVTTPSLTFGLGVAVFMAAFKENKLVKAALQGIRPATLGLIASAVIFFADTSLFTAPLRQLWSRGGESFGLNWRASLIFAVVVFAEWRWKCNMVWLLFASALMACLLYLIPL
ncbi:MAG: chromate transporter [Lentisphaeria bacterium]|jgi:chromate transporter|nr:chromate transporter [Lentisphaeria bacterium]NLZ60032.1 chromate transporter [Lentisphaerota bacterium]